jgi:hypothetical protein
MKLRTIFSLIFSHILIGLLGFLIGLYTLPILIAPLSPSDSKIVTLSIQNHYTTEFRKNLKDSDILHWGEGKISIGDKYVTFMGELSPGPDYKLYLSPEFIETEEKFKRLKSSMILLGEVKTFDNFIVELSPSIELTQFNTVVVWCETFDEFITSAKYR